MNFAKKLMTELWSWKFRFSHLDTELLTNRFQLTNDKIVLLELAVNGEVDSIASALPAGSSQCNNMAEWLNDLWQAFFDESGYSMDTYQRALTTLENTDDML